MFSLSNKLLTRKWGKCCFCMYGPQTKCSYACAHKGTCKRRRCLTVKETEVQRICHSFLKTTEPILPEKLQIGNGEFKIISCSGVHFLPADTYVLQCDLPLAENYRMMDGSKSCIKLGYGAKGKFLQAGSVIDRVDYFGSAVDI